MDEKKINIGVDIDEVIAEFTKPYLEFHNKKFGTNFVFDNISNYLFWEMLGLTHQESQALFGEFSLSHPLEDATLIVGAKDSLIKLSEIGKIFIITLRPEKITKETNKFLKKNLPQMDYELIHSGASQTKADICVKKKIKFMIEDSPKVSMECAQKGIIVFLFDKPWNKNIEHRNIFRVSGWKETIPQLNGLLKNVNFKNVDK